MNKILAFDFYWPNTGRTFPDTAELQIRYVHDKWMDLCWRRERDGREEWVYISTLPRSG